MLLFKSVLFCSDDLKIQFLYNSGETFDAMKQGLRYDGKTIGEINDAYLRTYYLAGAGKIDVADPR